MNNSVVVVVSTEQTGKDTHGIPTPVHGLFQALYSGFAKCTLTKGKKKNTSVWNAALKL